MLFYVCNSLGRSARLMCRPFLIHMFDFVKKLLDNHMVIGPAKYYNVNVK